MHVLHVAGALKGGPLSAIEEWAKTQIAAGHTVSLVYSPLRDSVDAIRHVLPTVALHPIPILREIDIARDTAATCALLGLMHDLKPDLAHLHSSKAGVLGRIAGRLAGVPTIYSTHGVAFLRTDIGFVTRAIFYASEWLLGALGNITVACSPSELATLRLIPGRKMVIPNGIDLSALPAPAPAPRHDGLNVAMCGRITAQKNPALAARVACSAPQSCHWTWLGDGELKELVLRGSPIQVTGWLPRSETQRRLGAADVLVHTSSWEGMPIAILEAMALGLPVVASDVVGNRDLVLDGETGFVARDEGEFVTALEKLAAAPELRRRMGNAARRRVETEFNQAKLGERWLALYRDVIG